MSEKIDRDRERFEERRAHRERTEGREISRGDSDVRDTRPKSRFEESRDKSDRYED